jgi:hypothetical protein
MLARESLERGRLVWLLTLTIRGRRYRFSTEPLAVDNAEELQGPPVVQFLSGLSFLEYEDTIGLFDSESSSREVSISVLFQQGQSSGWTAISDTRRDIGEATGELSLHIEGDNLADREIIVSGHIGSPTHGSRFEPVDFTIVESDWLDSALLPGPRAKVRKKTWPKTLAGGHDMRRDDKAKGQHYPLIFGEPGKYPPAEWWGKGSGFMPMTPALIVKIDTTDENNLAQTATILLAGHAAYLPSGPAVKIYNEGTGRWFDATPLHRADGQGRTVTVTDQTAAGTGAANYIEPGDGLWVAWTAAGGVPNKHETGPARGAGEIIDYLLGFSKLRIDTLRGRAVLLEVDGFALDFWTNEPRAPFDIIKEDILPLLPLSPQIRQEGLGFVYWRWDAVAADAVATLDVGQELGERSGPVEVSSIDDVYNTIRIDYCQDGPDGDYRKSITYGHEDPDGDGEITVNPYSWASFTRYGQRGGLIIDAPIVEQDDTARAILDWKIRYHSMTHRTVRYRLPQAWQAREVGDVITVSDPDIGWADVVCLITSIVRVPGYTDITLTTVADWIRDLT